VGCCEQGDELLGFIKCGEFSDWMRNFELLKDCVEWR
jgi:hypothetical protein